MQSGRADAQFLALFDGKPLLQRGTPRSTLALTDVPAPDDRAHPDELILLGLRGDIPIFAAELTEDAAARANGTFTELRKGAPYLSPADVAIAGQAVWLIDWHRRHRFCPATGALTRCADGGMKRINDVTTTEHFPRTDPVAIILPVHGDSICLGRGPKFPVGFLSAFAGFLDPCETLEECAARELHEETGLHAVRLEYMLSQPWPFPASLMVGFLGWTTGTALDLDPVEIEAAQWLSRTEAAALLRGEMPGLFAPPPFAIAHQLIMRWLAR